MAHSRETRPARDTRLPAKLTSDQNVGELHVTHKRIVAKHQRRQNEKAAEENSTSTDSTEVEPINGDEQAPRGQKRKNGSLPSKI